MQIGPLQYVTVVSGATLSSVFAFARSERVGMMVPNVDSSGLFIQAAPRSNDTFARITDVFTGSLNWLRTLTSSQTLAVDLSDHVRAFGVARAEFSVAQTDTRTLTIVGKA